MVNTKSIEKEAENLFLKRLKQKNIEASSDANLDCEVLDLNNKYFKIGKSPFYAKIKCRGSKTNKHNPQGHPSEDFKDILNKTIRLKIQETSLYVIVAFYKNNDIREMNYYIIPFNSLNYFKKANNKEYRFSIKNCEELMKQDSNVCEI